jgi:hypothetical protein
VLEILGVCASLGLKYEGGDSLIIKYERRKLLLLLEKKKNEERKKSENQ